MDEPRAGAVEEGDGGTAVLTEAPPRSRATHRTVCPFLIASTGDWRLNAPTTDHRCAAFVPLTALSLDKQARLCLTAGHTACATYAASIEARATRAGTGSGEPVERVGRWGYARTSPLIEDTGGLRGTLVTMISDRRTWPAIPAVLLVATLLAVGISGIRAEGQTAALATPTPAATPLATPPASVAATVEPTLEPTVAPSIPPSVAPSVAPTIAPTPAPSYQTYVVQSGDTLAGIASQFHTTVSAISKLNNISDPRILHIGQVLRIPT